MALRTIGMIMNGVTGRMGTNQHLVRSIVAIRNQGGVVLPNGDRLMPDPVLVGRNEDKLRALAQAHGIERWSTDLSACLANREDVIYFDAQTTTRRAESLKAAIQAGKHLYCEKPVAPDLATTLELTRLARHAGVKNGVVQDKLFLPGLLKLQRVLQSGFLGRILSVRGEFGYWVFEGDWQPAQRPSWNYRKEDGGGIIIDMLCHWEYVLSNLFGRVNSVSCLGATHLPQRVDEQRSEEHTSELQSPDHLVCRLLLEKKKKAETCKVRTNSPANGDSPGAKLFMFLNRSNSEEKQMHQDRQISHSSLISA